MVVSKKPLSLYQTKQLNIKIMKLELTVIDQGGAIVYTGSSLDEARIIRDFLNQDVSWCDNGAYIVIN